MKLRHQPKVLYSLRKTGVLAGFGDRTNSLDRPKNFRRYQQSSISENAIHGPLSGTALA